MMMFHASDPENGIDVHPSQIATMRNRGWADKPPVMAKPKTKDKKNGSS